MYDDYTGGDWDGDWNTYPDGDWEGDYDPGYNPDELGDFEGNDPYNADYNPTSEEMGGYESGGGSWFDNFPSLGSAGSFLQGLFRRGQNLWGSGRPGSGGSMLSSALGAAGGFRNAMELRQARDRAVGRADPFGPQRGMYQGLLAQSYNDPNFFANNPVFRGLREDALRDTERRMASQGYNMSGNQLAELNRTGINQGFQFAMPFQQQLGALSGAAFNPAQAGQLELTGSQLAGQADANAQAEATNFLGNLFGPGSNDNAP